MHGVLTVSTASQEGPALTENEFWMRYFFRKYQIEQDEERRKALLEGKCYSFMHLVSITYIGSRFY